jgi:hypothetical protein
LGKGLLTKAQELPFELHMTLMFFTWACSERSTELGLVDVGMQAGITGHEKEKMPKGCNFYVDLRTKMLALWGILSALLWE